ncbi:MAG: Xaa-Pro peptidase family protein [bacterium]
MNYKNRIKALRKELRENKLDGIIIDNPVNRRYFSGFTGSFGALFIDSRNAYISTDSRYFIQVKRQCPDFTLLPVGKTSVYENFMQKKKLEGKRIGFEADFLSITSLKTVKKILMGVKLVGTNRIPIQIRSIKTDDEIKEIIAAQKITDDCFTWLINTLKPGMTEIDIAWKMEVFMREKGASAISFDVIMASGPNSALPHAVPTNRKIKKGEPLLFDFGCTVNGYNSDMTRVFFLGKPPKKMELIYKRVLETHLMVFELSQPGTNVADIDEITRDYIYRTKWNGENLMGEAKGQGRYEHGLGHGVGLEVHELPVLSIKLPKDVLKPGHIVTNEPGIYIEGEGGVRIEDMMHITESGPVSLTKSPKEMIIL